MGQHLLIWPTSRAPLLLVGIRSPVYVFLLPAPVLVRLARRKRLRALFRGCASRSWRSRVDR